MFSAVESLRKADEGLNEEEDEASLIAKPPHNTDDGIVISDSVSSSSTSTGPLNGEHDNDSSINGQRQQPTATLDVLEDLDDMQAKSKPLTGEIIGKWDPTNPLGWSKVFGSRSSQTWSELQSQIELKDGDEGYFDTTDIDAEMPQITIVRTKEDARKVMEVLMNADPKILHACDTEVMCIDLSKVGPVGNGYVTCASIYSGPDFDYGLGAGSGSVLWIDNLDEAVGVLQEFKEWFEDERFLKVWHNYGFDRHVMFNEGIDVRGFGGDTMHMARLENTARLRGGGKGYSLEALTTELEGRRKKPMKEIFGVPRLRKDGTPGSLVDMPPVEVLQRDPRFRRAWIMYSAYDAEGTWLIRQKLEERLKEKPWIDGCNMFDYYWDFLREFGEVLTDMERRGIRVDTDYLADVEVQARKDRERHLQAFREWASTLIGPDGLAINPASSVQLCTFLFGGSQNVKTKEATEKVRVFKVPREEIPDNAMEAYRARDESAKAESDGSASAQDDQPDEFDHMKATQLKALCKEYGLKVSGKKAELQERLRGHFLAASMQEDEGDKHNDGGILSSEEDFDSMDTNDLRDACVVRGLSDQGNENTLRNRLKEDTAYSLEIFSKVLPKDVDGYYTITQALERAANRGGNELLQETLADIRAKNQAEPKYVDVTIASIGMEPEKYTLGGAPSVTAAVLKKLAGDPLGDDPRYGTAYEFFGGGEKGHEACVALYSLTAIGSIDTMIGEGTGTDTC